MSSSSNQGSMVMPGSQASQVNNNPEGQNMSNPGNQMMVTPSNQMMQNQMMSSNQANQMGGQRGGQMSLPQGQAHFKLYFFVTPWCLVI